tara:strand:+ start:8185 stop:9534 length:1350 start_codon:yes stop_codon:yes gene_type:complete
MEVCTIGGYEEVGKNMTAVKIGDDVIIFDAGVFLPPLIKLQEEEDRQQAYSVKKLRNIEAIPNDLVLDKLGWTNKVRAIVIGHAHLDHVGGLPYLADRYPKATIFATPFTMEVLKEILEDERISLKNKMHKVEADSYCMINKKTGLKLEFVRTTHSTIQCVFGALHSKEGVFFYALDFKFDNFPTLGQPPNYKRLKELGKKGVKTLVVDSLYSGTDRRTASERIARNLLEDALSYVRDRKSALFVTTFSSHIARLKSIVEFGKRTNREIVFIGRSLNKYVNAANRVGMCPFKEKIGMLKYRRQVDSFLRKVQKNRGRYLVVCTGHQAEPGSILDRIVKGQTGFHLKKGDHVIFSSSVIPVDVNLRAREKMDRKLGKMGVRVQTDIHVSGHGGREDLRDLVEMLKPKHIIPAHGSLEQEKPMIDLATTELGYKAGKTAHLSRNGNVVKIK